MQTEVPGPGRTSITGMVFAGLGFLFALGGVALLAGAFRFGVSLPPTKPSGPLISVFGIPAAIACGLASAIWLSAWDARRAGRISAGWAYCGLALLVTVVAVGLGWAILRSA